MAATVLAQELQVGQVCEKKINPYSTHYCGTLPQVKGTYTFVNGGVHDVYVSSFPFSDPDSGLGEEYKIPVNQRKSYILDPGKNLYISRTDTFLTERTLSVTFVNLVPCDTCIPDEGF
jgi:hypothetical protein